MEPYIPCSRALPPLEVDVLAIIDGKPTIAKYNHFKQGGKNYSYWTDGCYEWDPDQVTMWMHIPPYE